MAAATQTQPHGGNKPQQSTSHKPQLTNTKQQTTNTKQQAPSTKHQAPSTKHQATSNTPQTTNHNNLSARVKATTNPKINKHYKQHNMHGE